MRKQKSDCRRRKQVPHCVRDDSISGVKGRMRGGNYNSEMRLKSAGLAKFLFEGSNLLLIDIAFGKAIPFLESSLPLLDGLRCLPGLEIYVSEMSADGGIGGDTAHRFSKILFGEIDAVLFVIGPAQAVQVRAAVRLHFQRALNELDSLLQADSLVGKHIPEIIQCHGALRIQFKRFAELLRGLAH